MHILVNVDNVTAVSYTNSMGGTRSNDCNKAAKDLLMWCKDREILVTAAYLPGKSNIQADKMSRSYDRTEWILNMDAFQQIVQFFGHPKIDLFASRLNKQLCFMVA